MKWFRLCLESKFLSTVKCTCHVQQLKIDLLSKKGDKGDIGLRGDQGQKGEKGAQGEAGDPGDTGVRGQKGNKGDQGPTGPPGPDSSKDGCVCLRKTYILGAYIIYFHKYLLY